MPSNLVYKSLDFLGFPKHRVGNDGSVWAHHYTSRASPDGWKILKQAKIGKARPYLRVSLTYQGRRVYILTHRLVLLAFVGPCPFDMEACHFPDRSYLNNNLSNLRWDTRSANWKDKLAHGTAPVGTRNVNAKLSIEQIREVRLLYSSDHGLSQRRFSALYAPRYGVSQHTLRFLISGRSYKYES